MLDKKSMHNIRKKRKIRSMLDGNIDQETDINSKLNQSIFYSLLKRIKSPTGQINLDIAHNNIIFF